MKALFVKQLGSLRPADDAGREAMTRIGNGEMVQIELRRPRNIRFHRQYWVLVTMVWENMDQARYPTADDLHAALKIAAGLRTRIELPGGEVGFIPGSIAFHKMSADDFSAFYDRVADLIAKYFLPGITSAELKSEVSQLIGVVA